MRLTRVCTYFLLFLALVGGIVLLSEYLPILLGIFLAILAILTIPARAARSIVGRVGGREHDRVARPIRVKDRRP